MFNISMTDTQQARVKVLGETDKRGNAVPLSGAPVFASADPSICTFDADPADASGATGLCKATGPLASAAVVSITIGALVENGAVELTAGAPTGISTQVSAPEEQP